MSLSARVLLSELESAKDPNACLEKKYNSCTDQEREALNEVIGELENAGFLSVFWADDIAYHITLKKCNNENNTVANNVSNGAETVLIMGNNNTIRDSNIEINSNVVGDQEKKKFWEKHPFALALITGVIVAFVMMFSFWNKIVDFIEGLFS